MEPLHVNGSSGDRRSGSPATNSAEIAQINSANRLDPTSSSSISELPSQDWYQLVTNTTSPSPHSHDHDLLQPQSHHQFSVSEQGNGSIRNMHLGPQPGNVVAEQHPNALENMSAPFSSLSSSPLSSGDLRSGSPATKSAEIAQINSANRLDPTSSSSTSELPSQDQYQFATNIASPSPHSHDHDLLQPQSHHQFLVLEQGNGSKRSMHLGMGTQPGKAVAEQHRNALENMSAPLSSISSSPRSSGDLRSGSLATKSVEIAQINSANRLEPTYSSSISELPSQDQYQFVTNTSSPSPHSHDHDLLQPQSHHQFSVLEQGNGSTRNMHLGTQPGNVVAEQHPNALENMSAPLSSISSSPHSNGDLRSGSLATKPVEIAQINSANRLEPTYSSSISELPSQDQYQFVTNTSSPSPHSHDHDLLQPQSHHQFSVLEQGNGSTRNMHLGTQPGNVVAEQHPNALENMSAPLSSISSSQRPFEFPSDATNGTPVGANVPKNVHDQGPFGHPLNPPSLLTQQESSGMTNNNLSTNPADSNDLLDLQSSLSFSAHESSQADPSQVMPSSNAQTHLANNTHDETHLSSSSEHLGPSSLLSSSAGSLEIGPHNNTIPFTEQEHRSVASSNTRTDPVAVLGEAGGSNPDTKSGSTLSSFSPAAESSSQVPISVSENAASNPQTDTDGALKMRLDLQPAVESSDDNIPISSMPKNEQTGDVGGSNSPSVGADRNSELDAKNVLEVRNPPTQVMESPRDSNQSSEYRIPSHVFARNKSTTPEWSTASNESLFSIPMGNTSFGKELYWGKSGELCSPNATYMSSPLIPPLTPTNQPPAQQQGKSGELYSPLAVNISSPFIPSSVPTNQPPVQQQQQKQEEEKQLPPPQQEPTPTPPPLVNKLNDNRQPDDLNDGSRVIEAKAAETMREVMREKTENIGKGDLSFADAARVTQVTTHRISHYSHQSDGSNKSFMFPILIDEKSASSKHGDDKARQQNSEPQGHKEAPDNAAASPKSSPKAKAKASKWLPSCISCCWLHAKS